MNKKYGKWNSGTICRSLLWETCDLYAKTKDFEETYKKYYYSRKYRDFTNDEFRRKAKNIMVEFYEIFEKHVDIWPMFGTLLGMVRNNDIIPHDNDIDFGFFKKDEYKVMEILEEMHEKNGFEVIRNQFQTIFSVHKQGVLIDLYQYELLDGSNVARQGSRPSYDLMRDEIFPFKTIEFNNKNFKCINEPTKFFERYYGTDWQTPK